MRAPLAKSSRALLASRTGRWTLVGLILLAFFLLVLGRIEHPAVARLQAGVADLASPLLDLLSRPVERVDAAWDYLAGLGALVSENERLRAENERLRQWQTTALRLERENLRLRELLDLPPLDLREVAAARVIGVAGGPFVRSVLINAGRLQGVAENHAVIDRDGLVGRVLTPGLRSARVLLVTDLNSRVPVRLQASGTPAIARGRNDTLLELAFLPPDVEIAVGDHVVTSGEGGVFPPDIPVGRVEEVASGAVTVRPVALLSRLDFVRVAAPPAEALEPSDDEDGAP